MAKLNAEKIIYISCHVASQARDIARLTALGYAPIKSIPVDMFSYTSGIENIVLLQKA
jgi:23S rRNA (uracil1939-C5)-methyltransferase